MNEIIAFSSSSSAFIFYFGPTPSSNDFLDLYPKLFVRRKNKEKTCGAFSRYIFVSSVMFFPENKKSFCGFIYVEPCD